MKHRKMFPPFVVLIGCGVLGFLFQWHGSAGGNELTAEQNPPSQMRARFQNKTECNLGTVVFHYPGQDDVSLNVPGFGTFESAEVREGAATSIKISGVTYPKSGTPTGMVCNGEDHIVYANDPVYYDGWVCWDPWTLNGGGS